MGLLELDIDSGSGFLLFALGASGPSLAALVMWLRARTGRRRGRGVRVSATWPVAAVVLGAAPPLVTAVALHASDLGALTAHAGSVVDDVGGPLAAAAYTLISARSRRSSAGGGISSRVSGGVSAGC